jgi:hypothetical protein
VQFFGQGGPGLPAALGYPFAPLYATAAILGLVWLARRDWIGRTMTLPVLVTLAAAAVHQYPFSDRLLLFLLPSFCLGIAAFFQAVSDRMSWSAAPFAAAVALALAPTIYPVVHTLPPYRTENVKGVLAHVQSQRRPDDGAYVYYGGGPAVEFYAADYGLQAGDYAVGGCYRGDSRRYLEELDVYRGRSRVWVIVAHAVPLYAERDDMLGYLDAIGVRKDAFAEWPRTAVGPGLPAEAFLYDLSDATRLAATTAARFTLKGRPNRDARFGCTEGPQAMAPARRQSVPP